MGQVNNVLQFGQDEAINLNKNVIQVVFPFTNSLDTKRQTNNAEKLLSFSICLQSTMYNSDSIKLLHADNL